MKARDGGRGLRDVGSFGASLAAASNCRSAETRRQSARARARSGASRARRRSARRGASMRSWSARGRRASAAPTPCTIERQVRARASGRGCPRPSRPPASRGTPSRRAAAASHGVGVAPDQSSASPRWSCATALCGCVATSRFSVVEAAVRPARRTPRRSAPATRVVAREDRRAPASRLPLLEERRAARARARASAVVADAEVERRAAARPARGFVTAPGAVGRLAARLEQRDRPRFRRPRRAAATATIASTRARAAHRDVSLARRP